MIENLREDLAKMTLQGSEYNLHYGLIERFKDITTTVRITVNEPIKNVTASSSCGCTEPSIVVGNEFIDLVIKYDTKLLGNFRKLVTAVVNDKTYKFRIIGEVQQ